MQYTYDILPAYTVGTNSPRDMKADPLANCLAAFDGSIKVAPLRQSDIPKAAKSQFEAFKDDPQHDYLRNTPDAKHDPLRKAVDQHLRVSTLTVVRRSYIALTINHGESVIVAEPAHNSEESWRRKRVNRIAVTLYSLYIRSMRKIFDSPEQKRRQVEIKTKVSKVGKEVLGDKLKDMIYVELLATAPASQGRGYASTLLETICAIADKQDREVCLNSSNIANTGFYESHGFKVVGEVYLGADNPTWNRDPVIITWMVRKLKPLEEKV